MKMHALVLTGLSMCFGPALAQPKEALSLKGFTLGSTMEKCPPETTSESTKGALTMCMLPPSTVANEPVTRFLVVHFEGRVIGVMMNLPGRGQHANTVVRDALIEKFGPPQEQKSHLNSYTWREGDSYLKLDGWAGSILLADQAANKRAAQTNAKKTKDDL